jgi:hypothetical protein
MVEKFLCPRCIDNFYTAEGLLVHIKLLHPEFMACLHNISLGAACYAHRHLD